MPENENNEPIERRVIPGVTPWLIGGLLTIEATLLGFYWSMKNEIAQNSKDSTRHDQQLTDLRNDVNVIKVHEAKQDADIDYLKYQVDKNHGSGTENMQSPKLRYNE